MSDSPLFTKSHLSRSNLTLSSVKSQIILLVSFCSFLRSWIRFPVLPPLPHKQSDSASSPASPNPFDTLDCPGLLFCTGWSKCWVASESSWLSDALSKVRIEVAELQPVYFLIYINQGSTQQVEIRHDWKLNLKKWQSGQGEVDNLWR